MDLGPLRGSLCPLCLAMSIPTSDISPKDQSLYSLNKKLFEAFEDYIECRPILEIPSHRLEGAKEQRSLHFSDDHRIEADIDIGPLDRYYEES